MTITQYRKDGTIGGTRTTRHSIIEDGFCALHESISLLIVDASGDCVDAIAMFPGGRIEVSA